MASLSLSHLSQALMSGPDATLWVGAANTGGGGEELRGTAFDINTSDVWKKIKDKDWNLIYKDMVCLPLY